MRLRAFLHLAVVTSLVLVQGSVTTAQGSHTNSETALKAAFIYKFASFVEWPAGTFSRADQPVVIAISGDSGVAIDLEQQTAGRLVEGRPVLVKRIGENAVATGANIVFFSERRTTRLREAIEATLGPVVVVTEQTGALNLGSIINFSLEDGRVRFSTSLASAETRNLKLSARLLAVAQTIEGRNR